MHLHTFTYTFGLKVYFIMKHVLIVFSSSVYLEYSQQSALADVSSEYLPELTCKQARELNEQEQISDH